MAMYRFLECSVADYMTRDMLVTEPTVSLRELELLFAEHDFNAFPVVEAGRLIGLVTKFDFLKAFVFSPSRIVPPYDELMARTVGDVMTAAVVDVRPEAPLTRVLQLMVDLRARSFPVVDRDGHLVGIISREDIMRGLHDSTQVG